MDHYDGTAQDALAGQDLAESTHCAAHPGPLASIGRAIGQQVRLIQPPIGTGPALDYALYTMWEEHGESPDTTIYLGADGLGRLGLVAGGASTPVTVHAQCVRSTQAFGTPAVDAGCAVLMTDDEEIAKNDRELIERVCDDGTNAGLIVIAPHGGLIEEHTDDQAVRVANDLGSSDVSLWLCKGWNPGQAYETWHITSTEIHPESFPGLQQVLSVPPRFAHALSFHGFGEPDSRGPDVCIGGTANHELQTCIADTIEDVLPDGMAVEVYSRATASTTCAQFPGSDEDNIVNRLGLQGVQIEQSKAVREDYWESIAIEVAGVYAGLLP